jgi:hypothetical protein
VASEKKPDNRYLKLGRLVRLAAFSPKACYIKGDTVASFFGE